MISFIKQLTKLGAMLLAHVRALSQTARSLTNSAKLSLSALCQKHVSPIATNPSFSESQNPKSRKSQISNFKFQIHHLCATLCLSALCVGILAACTVHPPGESAERQLAKEQGKQYEPFKKHDLPELSADAIRGSQIYSQQCATCHAPDGAGQPPKIPAIWGPDAYSDGAGMNDIAKMAAFVQHNMPQTNPGSLTPQDAYDVAAYVHGKPHSRFELKEHR